MLIRKNALLLVNCIWLMVLSISGCGVTSDNIKGTNSESGGSLSIQDEEASYQSVDEIEPNQEADSEIDKNETELSINIKDNNLSVDIPNDFFDYRYWLGADVSVTGIDKASLKRQTGWIEIGDSEMMGYSGESKLQYNLDTDEIEKAWFMADDVSVDFTDYDILKEIEKIFGTNKDFDEYSVICSGSARYQLEMPKENAVVCIIEWNEETAAKHQYQKDSNGNIVREPALGMTVEEVKASTWGKPIEVKASGTDKEIWVYKDGGTDNGIYISFNCGIVQSVEEYEFHNKPERDEMEDNSPDYEYVAPEKKEPSIGMTESEVEASTWGKPKDKRTTTTKYGVSQQWIYSSNRYIYFEDGIVTAIQE